MKVLLVGATGNLGLRLVAALLTHGHTVVTYVRSAGKLESLLPASAYSQITVVSGDAKDSRAIQRAIIDSNCEAVVSAAGVAAMAPWGKSDLPVIFRAVLGGVRGASAERGRPLRVWFMAGMGVLYYPGTQTLLSSYLPIFIQHRENFALLKSLPPDSADWSMLCPATMVPESETVNVPVQSQRGRLIPLGSYPPSWQDSWLRYIPLIGKTIVCAINGLRYETSLEQAADFIAADLESRDSRWIGMPVGIIDPAKV